MHNKPWFYPLWVLFAFWAWALHVATGFLDSLIAARSGKRSGMVGMLNSFTEAILIGPIGRPLTVVLLVLAGLGLAFLTYRARRGGDEAPNDEQHGLEPGISQRRMESVRRSATVEASEPIRQAPPVSPAPVVSVKGSALEMTEERKARLEEVLAVDSDALREHFLWCLQEEEVAGDELIRRREMAVSAAFGEDPLPLALDLYARFPARNGLPTPTAGLRRLTAAFDAILDRGWLLSLIAQDPSLKSYNATRYDWKQSIITQQPLRMSDAQLSQAMQTVSRLIAGGASEARHKFENWYYYVVRAAVADNWPKHRDELIAMFSAGFTGPAQDHGAVVKLTESLLEDAPLEREDIPELVEFDRVSAQFDAVRASVFAELGDPLAQAMEVVLDNSGFIDSEGFPALRSLRELRPERRGEYLARLVSTISGLDRHGLDHWGKLKRQSGHYRFGLNHDPDHSVQPEMSFLFRELTHGTIVLPDRDATVSAFMDLLPFLIYLPERQALDLVLETARESPHGQTAGKLRMLIAAPMETHLLHGVSMKSHPFKEFRTEIEDTLRSLPASPRP